MSYSLVEFFFFWCCFWFFRRGWEQEGKKKKKKKKGDIDIVFPKRRSKLVTSTIKPNPGRGKKKPLFSASFYATGGRARNEWITEKRETTQNDRRSPLSPPPSTPPPPHTHAHAHARAHTHTHTHPSPLRFKVAIKKLKMSVSGVKTRPKGEG